MGLTKKNKEALLASAPFLVAATLLALLGAFVVDLYTPHKAVVWTWNGVAMFVSVCAGLGWIIHGTGFLLVKVN